MADEVFTRSALEAMAANAVGTPVTFDFGKEVVGAVTDVAIDERGLSLTMALDPASIPDQYRP